MVRRILRDIADVGRLGIALVEQSLWYPRITASSRGDLEDALDEFEIIFEPERPAINTTTGEVEFLVIGDEPMPEPWLEIMDEQDVIKWLMEDDE